MRVLFVCTGNTCRSALAEGMTRQRLGPGAGVEVGSAGLYALDGAPATPHAVEVAAEVGVDLSAHRARSLTSELAAGCDLLVVMTRSHAEALQRLGWIPAAKVEMLDPEADIADPYGGDPAAYRAARARIGAALDARLPGWQAAGGGGE